MSELLELDSTKPRLGPVNVFVYGTLKKGFGNHEYFLKNSKFLGHAQIEGIMFHIGAFPAINLGEKFSFIKGEVYQVDWEDVLRMDGLEGVPNHYHRIRTHAYPYKDCWMYIYPHERAGKQKYVIPTGEWTGPQSPKFVWRGWNMGVEVTSFQTDGAEIIPLDGKGEDAGRWILRKSPMDNQYTLIDKKTNTPLGRFTYIGEVIGADGKVRHKLVLPRKDQSTGITRTVQDLIKGQVCSAAATSTSIAGPPYTGATVLPALPAPTKERTFEPPQAAEIMGIKVSPA